MKTKYRNTSRRKTPWDSKNVLSPVESFIKSNYLDAYNIKHPHLINTNENIFINSFSIQKCRICGSNHIKKKGFTKNGIQRYICKNCHKSFNTLTNTIFDDHKISITEWIEFMLNIFRYGSINIISKTNKNSFNTSKYWLYKLFMTIEDIQDDIMLNGNVYIDETFFSVAEPNKITKNNKQLRGLSRNQYCIAVGYDGTQILAIVEGLGKTLQKRTLEAFKNHINPGSHLIHDKEKSHKILIETLHLTEDKYDAKELKKKKDKENPLDPINNQCDLIKRFLHSHGGMDREYLQDYLNLYCLIMNPPVEKLSKVEKVLNRAMSNPKKLTYRELYSKKQ